MIDSGSGVNLIKQRFINENIILNENETLILQGISSEPICTVGSVTILLLNLPTNFHVVPDTVGFPQDGILGNMFLKERMASIDYKNKCLHYDNSSIPFSETTYIHIGKRSVSPFYINVTNPEKQYGYIPRYTLAENVYFGEAIVTNIKGKAYLPIFNTTECEYDLKIPFIELLDFDFTDTLEGSTIRSGVVEARGNETTNDPLIKNSTPNIKEKNNSKNITATLGHPVINTNSLNPKDNHIATALGTSAIYNNPNSSIDNSLYYEKINNNIASVNFLDKEAPPCDRASAVMQLLRLEHLNSEESDNVKSLIINHSDRFHLPDDSLGATNATQHSIPTTDEIPIHTKQYRFPPVHKDEINKQVNELLFNGLIEYSTSPYNSPVWIVPKKPDSQGNKRWRMVIDYRSLNEKTIGDAYPLPNITDILDQLGSAKYFSVLDLTSGFHQIPMASKDAPKTAFSTPYGHYQFKRMPFGLKNAPATFQRLMDNVLSGLQGNELFVYMDDIVIYARSLKEHEVKFNKLMERLRKANLKLQPDKCEFLCREVAYLGHIIGADGTAKPLTDLLKKNNTFNWQQRQTEAFNILRNALCSEPVLQYPDFTKPFVLTTDASGYAIGGVLSQGQIGKDLPIAYTSRVLNTAEQNYSTIEKECLAIIYCTNHFRPYLYGKKFTIITDHKPLVWLHSIKDPSSRLWKWRTKLAEYEYEIQYKKGSLNNNADALSRNPPTNYILPLFTANPVDESSDESTFSFERRPRRPISDRQMSSSPIEFSPYNQQLEDNQSASKQTDITIEEYFSDDEMDRTIANSDEDSNQYEEIIDLNDEPQNTDRIIITENRDSLLKQSDNHVIFIYLNGTPFDNGAKEYQEANLLPNYQDLMYERANVKSLNHGNLISLPIKYNNRTNIEIQTLKNCIRSLLDVVMELELTSFSISKTDNFDDLPWHYIIGQIQGYLRDLPVHITVCKNLVRTPPFEQREALITENHSSAHGGHKGITKTYNRLRPHYYWKNMKKDIQNFIQRCRQCQLKKLTRIKTKQPMVITDTPGSAFDKVSLDIVGPLPITNTGNQYILTMQDLLTKYSVAVPLREATSLAIADALTKNFICIYGTPKAILTDQGTNFLSALMRNLTKRFNIQHFKTTAYHPQSNGSIERSHHVLTEYLKTQVEKEKEWDNYINMAMFSYNTSVHEGTKFSPFELIFGRIARLPSAHTPIDENLEITYQQYLTDLFNKINDIQEEARKNLIAAKERSKYYYDRKINPQNFRVGSYVFLLKEPARGKFSDQYTGPHEVIEILPQYNVKILIKNKPRIVHINKLKLAHVEPG
ncbi:hypothetical protein ACFW04_011246 [Cataglyphis niger]